MFGLWGECDRLKCCSPYCPMAIQLPHHGQRHLPALDFQLDLLTCLLYDMWVK